MASGRECYPIYQGQLSHENDNLNQRTFWYVFSQSFLFGAYASVVNAPQAAKNPLFGKQQDVLLWVIPITAILLSGLIYPLILISVRYMRELSRKFEAIAGPDIDELPPIHGNPSLRRAGDLVHQALPAVLILIWVGIIASQIRGA